MTIKQTKIKLYFSDPNATFNNSTSNKLLTLASFDILRKKIPKDINNIDELIKLLQKNL